jgi:hypothetical protein
MDTLIALENSLFPTTKDGFPLPKSIVLGMGATISFSKVLEKIDQFKAKLSSSEKEKND